MKIRENINYKQIEKALEYIKDNSHVYEVIESLDFQRIFIEWAGTNPEFFLQHITVEYAKKMLQENHNELCGTSRLHHSFIKIEAMTPAEYENGGTNLHINFSMAESPFGNLIIASTLKGICYMAFEDDEDIAVNKLISKFPEAKFQNQIDKLHQSALFIFQQNWNNLLEVKLHVKGTAFQLKVWESLLKIPMGSLSTYGNIAEQIGNRKAFRAVGTAIGNNPVAFLIPCHRVIQSSGNFGGYMWGSTRKTAIIGWEAVKNGIE